MIYQCPHCSEIMTCVRLISSLQLVTTCRACREKILVIPSEDKKSDQAIAIAFDPEKCGELTPEKQAWILEVVTGRDSGINPNRFSEDFLQFVATLAKNNQSQRPPISDAEESRFKKELNALKGAKFKDLFGPPTTP